MKHKNVNDLKQKDNNNINFRFIHFAVANNQKAMVQWLLDTKISNVLDLDGLGHTPFHIAMINSDMDIVKLLCKYANNQKKLDDLLKQKNKFGYNYLFICVAYGEYERLFAFIHHLKVTYGLDITSELKDRAEDPEQNDLLLMAAKFGQTNTMEWLINEMGFDINVQNKNGATPLMLAASSGHLKAVKMLLEIGKDDDKSEQGHTKKYCNISCLDNDRNTALKYAINSNNEKIVLAIAELMDNPLINYCAQNQSAGKRIINYVFDKWPSLFKNSRKQNSISSGNIQQMTNKS